MTNNPKNLTEHNAREEFVLQNEPLIHYVVKRNFPHLKGDEDAYQSGRIGLLMAYDGYNESLGASFSTYAYNIIRNSILNYYMHGGVINYPSHILARKRKIAAIANKAFQNFGEYPSFKELAEQLNLSEKIVIRDTPEYIIGQLINYDYKKCHNTLKTYNYFVDLLIELPDLFEKTKCFIKCLDSVKSIKDKIKFKYYYGIIEVNFGQISTYQKVADILAVKKQAVEQAISRVWEKLSIKNSLYTDEWLKHKLKVLRLFKDLYNLTDLQIYKSIC